MSLEPVDQLGRPVQEDCGVCGRTVPYSLTAHVLVHPNTDAGVVDTYICRDCYEAHLDPLFADEIAAEE